MTALDIIVLLLVGWFGVKGLANGFVTEVLSLGAWLLAILAVRVLHEPVTGALAAVVGTAAGASVLAFSLIFGITMFAGRMIARQVGAQSKKSMVGGVDRLLGAGFGALKGLVIATLGFLLFSLFYNILYSSTSERPKWMIDSKSYPLLSASAEAMVDVYEKRQGPAKSPNDLPGAGD